MTFEFVEDWARLPEGWTFGEVADVAVDEADRVWVFARGEHPVLVFDADGTLARSWGEGRFTRPHGMVLGPDDDLYLVDDGAHCVRRFSRDGTLRATIGACGEPAPAYAGRPFNRCTHAAVSPLDGRVYISDGYANARIHVYAPDGRFLFGWGASGSDPGEFNVPHNIDVDRHGYVYVADRENHRIQIFDRDGRFETEIADLHRPCALHVDDARGRIYVGELGPGLATNAQAPNLGPRVTILDSRGRRVARIGAATGGLGPGQLTGPHGIAVTAAGDLVVGEVSFTLYGRTLDPPREVRSLRVLRRVAAEPR